MLGIPADWPQEGQAMSVAVPARTVLRGAGGLIRRHKIISAATALFAAAAITVSLVTTSPGGATAGGSTAGFSVAALGGAPGAKVALAQYSGKPVIVNFWASWCAPCQQETPLLASWYKARHGQVALLGLDENDNAAAALGFARAKGVTYPLGFDPDTIAASAYNVDALPQTFFLDARHQVVEHVAGPVTKADLARAMKLMAVSS
jgi:cytochrome c biogenesis protein CcmG/thiol:disulfide interchange protein DsbE